jgi:hypothetical protein
MTTYTFSRALHLMRYGGKKMRSIFHTQDEYLFVQNGILICLWNGEHVPVGYDENITYLNAYLIMGSWVEVKETK